MTLQVREGEKIEIKGRVVTVTETAAACLPRIRTYLVTQARAGATTTYKAMVQELDLPYQPVGLGRVLDILSVDCERRGEPSLAAIVVRGDTGEVGDDFGGDPVEERKRVFSYWN